MECQFCDSNTYWSFKYPKQHIIVSGVAKFDRIFSNLLARRCITARDTNSARTFILELEEHFQMSYLFHYENYDN